MTMQAPEAGASALHRCVDFRDDGTLQSTLRNADSLCHDNGYDNVCLICRQLLKSIFNVEFENEYDMDHTPTIIEPHLHTSSQLHLSRPPASDDGLTRGCNLCRLLLAMIPGNKKSSELPVDFTLSRNAIVFRNSSGRLNLIVFGMGVEMSDRGQTIPLGSILLSEGSGLHMSSEIARQPTDAKLDGEEIMYYPPGHIVSPIMNLDLVKRWMQHCHSSHSHCRPPSDSCYHRRLIDVKSGMIVPAATCSPYVALSYVWGPKATSLLTKKTLETYTRAGSLLGDKERSKSGLPLTIEHAMRMTEALGFSYLWVDNLCIIQDDEADMTSHLPHMGKIYSHAALVLIATAGQDSDAGLPGIGPDYPRDVSQHVATVNYTNEDGKHDRQFVTTQPEMKQALSSTVWSQRGWTFQEALLARRTLVITDKLAYWNCRGSSFQEDVVLTWGEESPDAERHLLASRAQPMESPHWRSPTYTVEMCRVQEYCQQARDFSRRTFTNQSDALWAYMGILVSHAAKFPQGFIWALPYEKIDMALLWDVICNCSVHRDAYHKVTHGKRSKYLSFPSWSWLSTCHQVDFPRRCDDPIISEVTWNSPLLQLPRCASKTRHLTSSTSCWLKIRDGLQHLHRFLPRRLLMLLAGSLYVNQGKHDPNRETASDPSENLAPEIGIPVSHTNEKEDDVLDYGYLRFEAKTVKLWLRPRTSNNKTHISIDTSTNLANHPRELPGLSRHIRRFSSQWFRASHSVLSLIGRYKHQRKSAGATIERITAEIFMCPISEESEKLGQMTVPPDFFRNSPTGWRQGEFVLLSSNATPDVQDDVCRPSVSPLDCGNIVHQRGCKHIVSHNLMLVESCGSFRYRVGITSLRKEVWDEVTGCGSSDYGTSNKAIGRVRKQAIILA